MRLEGGRCRQATMNGHEARLIPPCSQMTDKKEILFCGVCRSIKEEYLQTQHNWLDCSKVRSPNLSSAVGGPQEIYPYTSMQSKFFFLWATHRYPNFLHYSLTLSSMTNTTRHQNRSNGYKLIGNK